MQFMSASGVLCQRSLRLLYHVIFSMYVLE